MTEPGEYRKLRVPTYAPRLLRDTAEGKYWRRFHSPKLFQQVRLRDGTPPASLQPQCSPATRASGCGSDSPGRVPHRAALFRSHQLDEGAWAPAPAAAVPPHRVVAAAAPPPAPVLTLPPSASLQVLLYDASTSRRLKQFTRFRETAYSGVLRADGEALAAGGEDGRVQLFDSGSRSVLRVYEGHSGAVRCVRWGGGGSRVRLASGGDDSTVRLWDVATGAQVSRFDGHKDYVRALAACSVGGTWASGGYDHSVCLWDPRAAAGGQPVRTFTHGQQVEDVCFFPSGGLLATAGGDSVCIWDLVAGRLLRRLKPHAKAVTSVRVYSDVGPPPLEAAEGVAAGGGRAGSPRMLTAGLDGVLKVFELDSFGCTHASRFGGPILSMAVAPGAQALAVGLANGTLALRRRMQVKVDAAGGGGGEAGGAPARRAAVSPGGGLQLPLSGRRLDAGSFRYFIRGQSSRAAAGDAAVTRRRRAKLAPFDAHLRRFRHREALDAALATKRPAVVCAVLEALGVRGAIGGALAGRDAPGLLPLLNFLARHVADPRYTPMLLGVTSRLLDIYTAAVGADAAVDRALAKLAEALREEARSQQELFLVLGALEPLLCAQLRGNGGRIA